MKKILVLISLLFVLCGCNQQLIDLNYKFTNAIILVGDEKIEVEISSWKDWGDSDMVQITTKDGVVYFTHSSNVILINK